MNNRDYARPASDRCFDKRIITPKLKNNTSILANIERNETSTIDTNTVMILTLQKITAHLKLDVLNELQPRNLMPHGRTKHRKITVSIEPTQHTLSPVSHEWQKKWTLSLPKWSMEMHTYKRNKSWLELTTKSFRFANI